MEWKTDSNLHDSEEEPYSAFQSNKSGRLTDRIELPIIMVGAGLLVLVILFVLFIPKKNQITVDDYKHLVSRIDQLEKNIEDLKGTDIDIREFDPANNPVQYQQLINWIKSNAEVISETIKKVDDIEQRLTSAQLTTPSAAAAPAAKTVQPAPKTSAVTKSPEKAKSVTENKSIEKSKPVAIKQAAAPPEKKVMPVVPDKQAVQPKPEVDASPKADEPKPTAETKPTENKPAAESKPVVETKPPVESKLIAQKPGTVKLIFHRVEKGETLYRISRKYGITVEKLQELNDMKKDDLLINVGQELIVRKEKQ